MRWSWAVRLIAGARVGLVGPAAGLSPASGPADARLPLGAQDARHSVYFLFEFDRAIRTASSALQAPIHLRCSYPSSTSTAPSPLHQEALHLLGLGFEDAVKGVFGLAAVGSALTAYLWLRLYSRRPAPSDFSASALSLADMYVDLVGRGGSAGLRPLCYGLGRLYPTGARARQRGACGRVGLRGVC